MIAYIISNFNTLAISTKWEVSPKKLKEAKEITAYGRNITLLKLSKQNWIHFKHLFADKFVKRAKTLSYLKKGKLRREI